MKGDQVHGLCETIIIYDRGYSGLWNYLLHKILALKYHIYFLETGSSEEVMFKGRSCVQTRNKSRF